tara:strand:+ start:2644 stop:3318 length:675 start_codon:yes stop_codon:yes gene_type:complete
MSRDIFISHSWGKDILNRPNHERAKYLSNLLVNQGYSVWFDEYDLIGNIDNAIIKGINDCKVVIICLTESYCNKINNSVYNNLPNDNCYKEWNYCLFKKKRIIPIIMEPTMPNIFLSQDGVIQMYLNNLMFINFCDYNKNEISNLYKTLYKYNVLNKNQKDELKSKTNLQLDKIRGYIETNLSPKKYLIFTNKTKKNNSQFFCWNFNFKSTRNLFNKKRMILRV